MVKEKINTFGIRGILRELVAIIFSALLLFASAGAIQWMRGWMFIGVIAAYQIVYILFLFVVDPHLLNERGTFHWRDTKLHDKYFALFYIIVSFFIVIIAGLDVVRFHYSSVLLLAIWPGIFMFAGFALFALWAYKSNASFLLTHHEEKSIGTKQICSTGPYRFVRHPGYLSGIGSLLSYPLILGSLLSIIPVLLCVILLVLRTFYEDKALMTESAEFAQYATMTRYRLFPYLW
jgi:protein-S-isoprenylcysteine O-methyltransferase Ste14